MALQRDVLQDDMRDPRLRVVVEGEATVVDSEQMPVRVRSRYELSQVPPVLLHTIDVEFIGECPPDVAERSESSHHVSHIGVRVGGIEARESIRAAIVRMKEDQISLQAKGLELSQALLVLGKIGGIKVIEVRLAVRAAQVRRGHF